MSGCAMSDSPDIELFFYDELDATQRARVAAHLQSCAACRMRLEDLHAIRRALAANPPVDAPAAGDWSGFMRRLDSAVGLAAAPPRHGSAPVLERTNGSWSVRHIAALAAMLAIVALGVYMAAQIRSSRPADPTTGVAASHPGQIPAAPAAAQPGLTPVAALREVSAEHLERSKLVVLGLATRDPEKTRPADWQYERELAGSLLAETRLYRLAAQERGVADVAHVMRDLETVLLEASMSDGADRESLERVQRLIARRGLVSKMQIVATTASGL